MRSEDFDLLVASIEEAGDIKAGCKKPARVFEMNVVTNLPTAMHNTIIVRGSNISESLRCLFHFSTP